MDYAPYEVAKEGQAHFVLEEQLHQIVISAEQAVNVKMKLTTRNVL